MKKTIGKKIQIIKENPVARELMGSRYRMKVKVSKKVYRRADQKRNTRAMLKNENGPMRSLFASVAWWDRSLPWRGVATGLQLTALDDLCAQF